MFPIHSGHARESRYNVEYKNHNSRDSWSFVGKEYEITRDKTIAMDFSDLF